jgi:formylglycine-generating enzyme required for sulfatase activity
MKKFFAITLWKAAALLLAANLIIVSGCKKRSIWDTKRIKPLEILLKQQNSLYGVKAGDYLIPETIAIPGGQFAMGSDNGENIEDNEKPRHRLSLSGFEIGRLEVTNAQFAEFVKATGYENPEWQKANTEARENYPAVAISWHDAVAYCQWLTTVTDREYRLPTEAEWEYAAGGAQNMRFSWGNQWDTTAGNVGKQQQGITAAAKYPANGFALYDINGNVWEWCADWFDENYYPHSEPENPAGPAQGQFRVQRGGAWNSLEATCRIAFRSRNAPDKRAITTGFRVVSSKKKDKLYSSMERKGRN